MSKLQIPGLSDVHVHLREPGATHKEDWDSGTAAALAGGITTVLAMPNTSPSIVNQETFNVVSLAAAKKARCDYAQFLGAGPDNAVHLASMSAQAAGLKMYLNTTYGDLRLDEMTLWMSHFERWPKEMPISAHAEKRTLAAVILMASIFERSIHICHVSRKEEILLIRAAKKNGHKITCEVSPHHLFLTQDDIPEKGRGKWEVRPKLASRADQEALWDNLDIIDCFASDHAPHTFVEKESADPPPGFPGLETTLPLLLTAVKEGRLKMDDIVKRMYINPQRIFNLPQQPKTFVEIDTDATWEIKAADLQSRCGWTPFESRQVQGRIRRVVLRGKEVFRDGELRGSIGYGKDIRQI